jgi:hypothetical protein
MGIERESCRLNHRGKKAFPETILASKMMGHHLSDHLKPENKANQVGLFLRPIDLELQPVSTRG